MPPRPINRGRVSSVGGRTPGSQHRAASIQMTLPIEIELPSPNATPLDRASAVLSRLSKAERRVAEEALRGHDVFLAVKSRGRADTGGWLWRRRVWAFALADGLVLLAAGRVPYVERIPYADLHESVYNAVTGELALAPASADTTPSPPRRLKMTPLDGYQMLAQIYSEEPENGGAAG